MNCEDAKRLMDAWADGVLDPGTAAALESHLRDCRSCAALAKEVKYNIGLLDCLTPVLPSPGLRKKTLTLFTEAAKKKQRAGWWSGLDWKMQVTLATSSLAGFFIGMLLGTGWTDAHQQVYNYEIFGFFFSAGEVLMLWT